jgi:MerR family redox-sensitive transcriptional activator SoxR
MERVSEGSQLLSVGQLSARSGVAVSALHFYEAQGLIHAQRSPGNQRRYARETLRRVGFIRASQAVGIPLRAVKEALDQLPARAGRRPGRTGHGFRPPGGPTSTNGSAISSRFVTG